MVISHLIWMFRTQGIRRRAAEAATHYDDYDEAIRWQAEGVDLQKMCSRLFAWKEKNDEFTTTGEEAKMQSGTPVVITAG
jgi:hypothetical protein